MVRISIDSGFALWPSITRVSVRALGITMAEDGSSTDCRMDVRLLINKKNRRVLYAEAGKDFVDLLFGFLLLPVGGIIRLLRQHGTTSSKSVASISNVYNSVDKLNATYMTTDKTLLLKPHESFISYNESFISENGLPRIEDATSPIYYACCNADSDYEEQHQLSTRPGQICVCGEEIANELQFLHHPSRPSSSANRDQMIPGYVKETVTFIITDDLNILPISTITSITLLNQLQVKDLSEMEEMTVTVGPDKVLELLWASMASTTALNDVFSPSSSTASASKEEKGGQEGPSGLTESRE